MQNKIIASILSMFLLVDILLVYLALTVSPIKLKRLVFTYEYGEEISTDVGFYVNANPTILKSVKLNLSNVSTNVGKYQASIEYSGKKQTFDIQVVDTVKPKVQLKKVEWMIQLGQSVKAQDLIKNVEDQSKTSVYFYDEETKTKTKQKSYNQEGSYIERLIVEDEHKNQSASLRVKIVVETNKVLPIITGAEDMTIYIGEEFDFLKGVKATDDIEGDITSRMMYEGIIDNQTPGVYQIVYTVSDNVGNIGKVVRKVTVAE